jgi:cold shock protein
MAMATGTLESFKCDERFRLHPTDGRRDRRFVHISGVERGGMRDLNEGQKISYDVVADKRTGKSSAANLKPA